MFIFACTRLLLEIINMPFMLKTLEESIIMGCQHNFRCCHYLPIFIAPQKIMITKAMVLNIYCIAILSKMFHSLHAESFLVSSKSAA